MDSPATVSASQRQAETWSALEWLALSGAVVVAAAGLLMAVPRVLVGHSANALPALSFISILVLVYGLPVSVVLCNVAAFQRGGRRAIRCAAMTAALFGGLALTWWLSKTHVRPSLVFHGDGAPTLDYSGVRLRGLLASAVAVAIPFACFWLLRPGAGEATSDS